VKNKRKMAPPVQLDPGGEREYLIGQLCGVWEDTGRRGVACECIVPRGGRVTWEKVLDGWWIDEWRILVGSTRETISRHDLGKQSQASNGMDWTVDLHE
jgi:hypothetical protein